MIRRILLPIGGDSHQEEAVDCAASLALMHRAAINVLGVVDVPGIERSSAGAGPGASHYSRELRERRLDHARELLGQRTKQLVETLGQRSIEAQCEVDAGSVAEVISRHSRRTDLVVVGRESNFQFETSHEPRAQTLLELLRWTLRLTLVVPQGFRGEFERVVIAHDLRSTCSRVLYTMIHVNPFPGADYIVVHADPQGTVSERELDDIVGYMGQHALRAAGVVRNLQPAKAVLDVADERSAQAIVLGPYDVGSVRRLLLGSTAATILEETKIPLLFGI